MNMFGNTILITGGATGIGLAFAERFLKADNEVIIVGRREEKLQEVKEKYPMIHTRTCDISNEDERKSLVEWVASEFPKINVLINNAGIQQSVNLLNVQQDWSYYSKEMAINLEGPIHLSMLLIPYFIKFALGNAEIAYGDAENRIHFSKKELDESTKIAWENLLKNNPNF